MCRNSTASLELKLSNGNDISYDLNAQTIAILNSANTIDRSNCQFGEEIEEPVFMMTIEPSSGGIIGSYEEFSDSIGDLLFGDSGRKRRQTGIETGILNPITCIDQGIGLKKIFSNRTIKNWT